MRRFGLYLSLQHPEDRDPRELVAERLELVTLVREAGFDSVFCGQHFLVPPDVQMLQPVPVLGRIAAEAGRMTIGTGILITTLLNPVEVAENAATLAAIAPGRFVLGAGVGYRPEENAAFGVERGRIAAFEGKLRVVRQLLDGEEVTASGPGYRLDGASLTLRPVPRPELWVAATTEAGIERAASLGDAWLAAPSARVSEIRRGREVLTARLGHEPAELPALREAVVAPTHAEAVALAGPFLDPRGTSSAGRVSLEPGRYIVGGPGEAAGELEALFEAGVDHVIFRVQRPGISYRQAIRTIELLASDVIPSVAG